jgi:hypothetical protein
MAVDRTYRCDLCRDPLVMNDYAENRAIGIYWKGFSWEPRPAREVEHHLCPRCISSIQAFPAICGQGFKCTGGPTCGSDHK